MEINTLPRHDSTDNPTRCCARFEPAGSGDQELHFKDKLGAYREVPRWHKEMLEKSKAPAKGPDDVYFFCTTCPKCAKAYGQNYVVAVAQVA